MAERTARRLTRRSLLAIGAVGSLTALAACAGATTPFVSPGCTATVNGSSDLRDLEQAGNVAIIVGEALRRGLPPRAATIAIVTALQESKLYNLDYGDADSVGLFQQRPSQGWGTEDQIMNPWYSAGKFYEALVKVDGWQTDTINDVAQKVQRSNFPHAYAQHEDVGRIWASDLCGFDPAGVTSVDNKNATGNPEVLREFVVRVWGGAIPIAINPDGLSFTVGSATTAWSVALLCMCLGSQAGLVGLRVGDMTWANSTSQRATWAGQNAVDPTVVTATCRTA